MTRLLFRLAMIEKKLDLLLEEKDFEKVGLIYFPVEQPARTYSKAKLLEGFAPGSDYWRRHLARWPDWATATTRKETCGDDDATK